MIFFKEVLGLHYLIATCLSFMISTIANYLLSLRFVFKSRTEMNKGLEFVIYAVLSAIGLGLTELLMWVTVDKLGIYYMVAKIIVTAIVMVYNFITRKLFLEKKNKNTREETTMEELMEILHEIRPDVDFAKETALIDDGILGSFDITALVNEIMDAYDVEISMADLEPDNFNSAEAIWDFVQSLK